MSKFDSKHGGKSNATPSSMALWLIHKYNTNAWREGNVTGMRNNTKFYEMLPVLGREELFRQLRELEREGFLKIDAKAMGSEIKKITVNLDRLGELCEREGVPNPRSVFAMRRQLIRKMKDKFHEEGIEWLEAYYASALKQMESTTKKELPDKVSDLKLLQCLNALGVLKEDVWMRQFSAHVLHNSKAFEQKYKKKVANILKRYSTQVVDAKAMVDEEILAEYHMLSYSQTIEFKGSIQYITKQGQGNKQEKGNKQEQGTKHEHGNMQDYGEDKLINGADYPYGHIVNAQTMEHSQPISLEGVRRIISIENKANYESQEYQEDVLYIYCHGFLSHKERVFWGMLNEILPEDVEIYHWSDMDYGGMRIFKYMKERVFAGREVKPYKMGARDYLEALEKRKEWKVFGEDSEGVIKADMRKKIEAMNVPELEMLKQCILEHNIVFEQEYLLDWSNHIYDFTEEDSQGII